MTTYGFIGLGHQGTPMAERMIAGGLQPWLWARRTEVLDRYPGTGSRLASSPADLGANCDVIGLCLYDAEATDAVLFGPDGVLSSIRPGTVLAVHATVGRTYVQHLARRVAARGGRVVDAPVSGGPAAAEGKLLVMVGGDDSAIDGCRPMFDTYSDNVVHLGEVGAAQATKLLNNALMAAITGLVFDAFDLGEQLGIDRAGLGAVLAGGSAANPSVGHYLAAGAEQLSINAWPTLHKDVALVEALVAETPGTDGLLVGVAASTIATMARLRADYVREREPEAHVPALEETGRMDPLEVVQAFDSAWADHDLEATLAWCTDDCVFESTGPAPDAVRSQGHDELRAAWQPIFDDQDARFSAEETFVAGDRVVHRWRYDWADGHVRGIDVFRVRDGKVAEKLSYVKG